MLTLTPAIAATPNPSGSTITSPQSKPPPMSSPVHHAQGPTRINNVALLQEALDSTGANLRVDGMWGPVAQAALKHYQQQNGLKVTGHLDEATRTRLDPIG
jgi:peptidoglycan hydrolase-like protein with peptidoglycan-binding domain